MRLVILTVGTRGDVEPYLALGLGLRGAGYEVRLVTDTAFEQDVRECGLEFAPLGAAFLSLLQTPEGRAALAGKNRLGLMRRVMPLLEEMMDDAWAAAQDADALVYHPKALAGYHIAERLNAPGLLALAAPLYSLTAAFASPLLSGDYGPRLNRLSHQAVLGATLLPYRRMINRWRKTRLGLPAFGNDRRLHGRPVPKPYAYSPLVVPRPDDWDASSQATGYWVLERDWSPPPDLLAFLEGGPPPVYVGFGSMVGRDAAATTALVRAALREAGQRGILATGYGGLDDASPEADVYTLGAAPHGWLFPRCAALVHHGGAGTTGAGLRAGKPTVVCPFFGDQPFWGTRVAALGLGPPPLPQKRLTAAALARAVVTAVSDAGLKERAEAMGERLRQENGVARAVALIGERLAQAGRPTLG